MNEIKLSHSKTTEIVNELMSFYNKVTSIQEYFLEKKKENVMDVSNGFMYMNLFNDYNLQPKDFDITIEELPEGVWSKLVTPITSAPMEQQIGRRMCLGIKENNTGQYLGFIRLASPVLQIKPRNNYFGDKVYATTVNKHMINGSVIVPTQPFGFNSLGGKLLSLICVSHEVREMFNKKYDTNICWFETTSLYGSIKGLSQYDGLKPFIRYLDMTESDIMIFPTNEVYRPLLKELRDIFGRDDNNKLVQTDGSSPKMREFTKFISILKNHLKHYSVSEFKDFNEFTKTKMKSKTQKRFYYSNYGFENVKEFILSEGNIELEKGINYEKHNLDNVINWWKTKAQNRWETLTNDNSIRKELEYWTYDKIMNNSNNIIR